MKTTDTTANIRLNQLVYWRNLFGITNYGRVESVDETFVTVRLPDDEEAGGARAGTVTLARTVVATSREALKR